MSQVLTQLTQAVKWLLRPLADALLASSRTLPARIESCLAESAAVAGQVEKRLTSSEALTTRIEECLVNSTVLPQRLEETLADSALLPERLETCLRASPELAGRIELYLATSPTVATRLEEVLAVSPTLPNLLDEYLAASPSLAGRFEEHLATSRVLGARVEEYLAGSETLTGRIENTVALSESLGNRIEEHLTNSTTLADLFDEYLAASATVPAQLYECVQNSAVLTGRIEDFVATSEVVASRIEECLTKSQILPQRVEECVRSLRALADRIEECLWSSRALPRRIDEHLAGSKALPDVLVEECLRRSAALPQVVMDLLPDNPCLAAVVHPYQEGFPVGIPRVPPGDDGQLDAAGLPVPPRALWEGYGPTAADYLDAGRMQSARLRELLDEAGMPLASAARILDLTCGAGRVLRWLADLAPEREIWGTDMSAAPVIWVRQRLCPPFRAATRSTAPHLPFEDRFFDVIYSVEPFGRPPDLADAWLLELKRVLRPGGKLLVSVLDQEAVARLLTPPAPGGANEAVLGAILAGESYRSLLREDYDTLAVLTPTAGVYTVFNRDALLARWGRDLRVLSVTPGAFGPFTAVLLERAQG